jgi:hypothetical protein
MILALAFFLLFEGQPPPTRSARLPKSSRAQFPGALRPRPSGPVIPELTKAHSLLGSQNNPQLTARDDERKTFRIPREQRANEPSAAASFNPGM